jgi:hypothetical protein
VMSAELGKVSLKHRHVTREAGEVSEIIVSVSCPITYHLTSRKECRFRYNELRQYTALI